MARPNKTAAEERAELQEEHVVNAKGCFAKG